MNSNIFLAVLAKLELVEPAKAKELAKRINEAISPARYEEAVRVVEDIFKDVA